jgi:hypothetical protein
MERSVRDTDYVLVVCTPHYAERSDARLGGVPDTMRPDSELSYFP